MDHSIELTNLARDIIINKIWNQIGTEIQTQWIILKYVIWIYISMVHNYRTTYFMTVIKS